MRFLDGALRTVPKRVAIEMSYWESSELADEIRAVYDAYDGGDVVDVGAWHGFYSLALAPKAQPGARFVSLEPDPIAFPNLLERLVCAARLFPDARFVPLPFAAGDGTSAALDWPTGMEGSHPHPRIRSGAGEFSTVRVDGVVEALGLRPALVKIDVEGAELDVLRGMPATTATGPLLMLELHPWQEYGDLATLLPSWSRHDVSVGTYLRSLWTPPPA